MSIVDVVIKSLEFNRTRTLALLDRVEKLPDPAQALAWQPATGRAHVAWQLMHLAVTEDIFATQHLAPDRQPVCGEWWARFRQGSSADQNVPTVAEIRQVLTVSRANLLTTLALFGDDRLSEIPESFKQRGWTVHDALNVIVWHEPHHQGQAHITLNLYSMTQ
ncbi:MAG: DinB family protein [Planctomycetota bacterium]|nr:DinB family protein [Planctomycetota bacterium]